MKMVRLFHGTHGEVLCAPKLAANRLKYHHVKDGPPREYCLYSERFRYFSKVGELSDNVTIKPEDLVETNEGDGGEPELVSGTFTNTLLETTPEITVAGVKLSRLESLFSDKN